MTALIRIKRSLSEEPFENLIIKKMKMNEDEEDNILSTASFLKLAGTIENDDELHKLITKSRKEKMEEEFKKHNINIRKKIKDQKLKYDKNNRYKIINYFRSDLINEGNKDDSIDITIIDIESDLITNKNIERNQDKSDYVFDLYYTTSDNLGDSFPEENFSVYPYNENLLVHDCNDQSDVEDDISDDSNAENYYKNDYPDEEVDSVTDTSSDYDVYNYTNSSEYLCYSCDESGF